MSDPFAFTKRLTVYSRFRGTLTHPPPVDYIPGKTITGWVQFRKTHVFVPIAANTGTDDSPEPFFHRHGVTHARKLSTALCATIWKHIAKLTGTRKHLSFTRSQAVM